MKYNSSSGFTLIEIAIVMIIIGILIAGITSMFMAQIKKQNIEETLNKISVIDEAVQTYARVNGRYPCAAAFDAPPDGANAGGQVFGVEVDCAVAAVAGETVAEASDRGGPFGDIRIGAVPTRTLNIPDQYAFDAWGRRITYAVTETLVNNATFDTTLGGISIVDSDAPPNSVIQPPNSAHYYIVSHGESGDGAVPRSGGVRLGCNPADLDSENCNDDSVFVETLISSDNANFYDDLTTRQIADIVSIPPGAVVAFNLPGCPPGWTEPVDAGGNPIYGGRFILGAGQYAPAATETPYEPRGPMLNTWAATNFTFNVGDTGDQQRGQEAYELSLEELPLTSQAIQFQPGAGSDPTVDFIVNVAPPTQEVINLIPPFYTLLYCQKT
jgi:prepilin-type N-terminal cleavage/methylation domain-containing protein